MLAEIITIGDEILVGQTVDTNSNYMARELNFLGLQVHQITTVADDREHILHALADAQKRSDAVLITGGLGPTKDDITRSTLCEFFETRLINHDPTLKRIQDMFRAFGKEMMDVHYQQAMVPESCIALENQKGTAPGMWFEHQGVVFVSMPGVPREMMGLMQHEVLPRLQKKFQTREIAHVTVMTQGMGASSIAERIEEWADQLSRDEIKLAYLPGTAMVKLRLSRYGNPGDQQISELLNRKAKELMALLPSYAYSIGERSLPEVVGEMLRTRGETVATAESCTGGTIASLITSISGSSDYYPGSVVSYSNEVKVGTLGVSQVNLDTHGAVSKEVVEEMASGIRQMMNTTWGIATSGVAGPNGGTEEKPVGTVWIAIAGEEGVRSKVFRVGAERKSNIMRSALTALNFLRLEILRTPFGN